MTIKAWEAMTVVTTVFSLPKVSIEATLFATFFICSQFNRPKSPLQKTQTISLSSLFFTLSFIVMANQLPEVESKPRVLEYQRGVPIQCQLLKTNSYESLHPSIRPVICTACSKPHEPYDKYLYPDGTTSNIHPNTRCEDCKITPLDEISKGCRIGPCEHGAQRQFHAHGRSTHDKITLLNVKLAADYYDLPWFVTDPFIFCINKEFGTRDCDANHDGFCYSFPEKPKIVKSGYRGI